ncbi:MAG: DNA alkylation repair protein [Elusimicrobia bacterium]|nr:DNA alkylation repair protein [Elusimicrobiota bacterium]MBU2615431.1 DNA alkylation repair protein [Elusimicrobiota bacterium]
MNYQQIISKIKSLYNPKNIAGMKRFGINVKNAYGVPIPELRKIGRLVKKDHEIAKQLWNSGIHEARILASIVDDPKQITSKQMDDWVKEFNSWDICDQCCMNLFSETEIGYNKAIDWAKRKEEFEKRAGFALMAVIAVHNKKLPDKELIKFFPIIKRESTDERNFVRKAVNWALRQIGKRNMALNREAVKLSKELKDSQNKSACWIGTDAYRELTNPKVVERIKNKKR